MAECDFLAADRIHDYIDGRLSDRDRAAVAAYLITRPRAAAEVEALRCQSEILRGIAQGILDEPVPPRLREVLQRPAPAGSTRR
jgi:anti-sigma factor RsiW